MLNTRFLILAIVLCMCATTSAAEILIDFDDVVAGTVINSHYAPQGLTLIGVGNGGPFDVITQAPCIPGSSAPNSISIFPDGFCPETFDNLGWFRVEFAEPQPRVSIVATQSGDGASYLKAFTDGESFPFDQKFGQSGPAWVNVPQAIEVLASNSRMITAVEFGAIQGTLPVGFDDLSFEITPVATERSSWGTVKATF